MKNIRAGDTFIFWCLIIIIVYWLILKPIKWMIDRANENGD